MNGFKNCSNGHWYKQELDTCPYCPALGGASGGDSTQVAGANTGTNDFDKTAIGGVRGGAGLNPTETVQVVPGKAQGQGNSQENNFDRTFIGGVTNKTTPEGESVQVAAEPRKTRKIVGWIISFTLDEMGLDFRLYEGQNSIGREASNNITIAKDSSISSKHAIILYRESQGFFIRDDMSANGTFLNGEELEIGKPYPLKDGDKIGFGRQTQFVFKTFL